VASPSRRSVSSARQSKKGEDVPRDIDGPCDDTGIANTTPSYFLVKSEPHEFSIQDLQKLPDSTNDWDGVRNYQARNIMRSMKRGDRAFFYHSSCKVPAMVGTLRIVQEARPDPTALDPNHKYYDPKSTRDNCRWDIVSVQLEQIYPVSVTLLELKTAAQHNPILADMSLFRNSRLSVQHVTEPQWNAVEELMAQKQAAGETALN
jgi:predicted RNA-binding protein with PUA-like domain